MVKFSNKAKAKPSKRKNLKTKYKIDRKVKQHQKKMKKEAKKMSNKGIKLKSILSFYARRWHQKPTTQYVPVQKPNSPTL